MADLPPSYAISQASCSTCAQTLSFPEPDTKKSDATVPLQQICCGRRVCGRCIDKNPRFATYCPFCPASTRILPPSYSPPHEEASSSSSSNLPPGYKVDEKSTTTTDDVLHFVKPTDTLAGLSLLYNVPAPLLRSYNRLFVDAHLLARQAIAIPTTHYSGPSHSARPEEDDEKKSLVKRFQLRTKCVDVKMAEVYLEAADGGLEEAVETYRGDEGWVKEQEERERRGKGVVSGRGMRFPW